MQKDLLLGVDPGFFGALALYDAKTGKLVDLIDMPVREARGKKHLDLDSLSVWLDMWSHRIRLAVIEEVSAMPGNGTSSSFRFGYYAGVLVGLIYSRRINMFMVKPAVWKALLGLSPDKALSIKKASELLPMDTWRWVRKKDDGRAEAALLAVMGERWQLS